MTALRGDTWSFTRGEQLLTYRDPDVAHPKLMSTILRFKKYIRIIIFLKRYLSDGCLADLVHNQLQQVTFSSSGRGSGSQGKQPPLGVSSLNIDYVIPALSWDGVGWGGGSPPRATTAKAQLTHEVGED